jgi:hypothetical protein
MTSPTVRVLAALLLPLGLIPTLRAEETPSRINDRAGLFRPEVVDKAAEKIARIQEVYHLNVGIETVKELPEETIKRLKKASNPNRELQTLALEHAHQAGVEGIFILVSVVPKYKGVQVVVRPRDAEGSFSSRDCDHVRKLLQGKLEKSPNDALLNAVEEIQDLVGGNRPAERDQVSGSITWKTVALLVGSALVLWLVLALIRMKLTAADAGAAGTGGPRDTFLAGLLGGMFGNTAAHWIHDNLFQTEAVPAPPAPAPIPPEAPRHVVVEDGEQTENKLNSAGSS